MRFCLACHKSGKSKGFTSDSSADSPSSEDEPIAEAPAAPPPSKAPNSKKGDRPLLFMYICIYQ